MAAAAKPKKESPTVTATWVGPFVAESPEHGLLVPGETKVKGLPRGEAEASNFWRVED